MYLPIASSLNETKNTEGFKQEEVREKHNIYTESLHLNCSMLFSLFE